VVVLLLLDDDDALAASRSCVGSSPHGRAVATRICARTRAFRLPRIRNNGTRGRLRTLRLLGGV